MRDPGQGGNPADDFEQRESASFLAEIIVKGILSLPPHQKQAILWHLKKKAINIVELTDALSKAGIDLEMMEFPSDKAALNSLRTLRSIAIKKIRAFIEKENHKEL